MSAIVWSDVMYHLVQGVFLTYRYMAVGEDHGNRGKK